LAGSEELVVAGGGHAMPLRGAEVAIGSRKGSRKGVVEGGGGGKGFHGVRKTLLREDGKEEGGRIKRPPFCEWRLRRGGKGTNLDKNEGVRRRTERSAFKSKEGLRLGGSRGRTKT